MRDIACMEEMACGVRRQGGGRSWMGVEGRRLHLRDAKVDAAEGEVGVACGVRVAAHIRDPRRVGAAEGGAVLGDVGVRRGRETWAWKVGVEGGRGRWRKGVRQ